MIDIEEYIKRPLSERQSHLDLNDNCIERGGFSSYFKGLLAHVLNTSIPSGIKIHVCHACGNGKCSNPKHLYFGTPKENILDGYRHGTIVNAWQSTVKKYGIDEAMRRARENQRRVNGKNTFYITDGKVTKRHPIGSTIPDGWNKGRAKNMLP